MRLAAGHRLGHYEIVDFIGEGGMGEVYRARDLRLRREVAVKVLQASEVQADQWARFEREAHSASALSHPNICTVHDFGEESGRPYLVMELVDGVTLRHAIESGGLDPSAIVPLAIQMADALESAHAQNIVHRDVKPGNVMITRRGHAKMLDFGLAKLAAEAATGHTATMEPLTAAGAMVGTPQFLAPEILQGGQADLRSDVWSFGVMLYQMVSGKLPFTGATPFAMSSAILHDAAPPLPPPAEPRLRLIVEQCLRKLPAERYQHAGEIRKALEALRLPASAPTGSRWPAWVWVSGLLLAAALAGGLVWWTARPPDARLTSNGTPASAIQEALDAYELGVNVQRVQNEIPRALSLYERAIQIDPTFAEARRNYAFTHVLLLFNGFSADLGLLYKAEEELQRAARDAPDLFTLPSTQTALYLAQGRKELVPVARLNEVGLRYPQHPDTAIFRFILLMYAEDNEAAKGLGLDALQRQPLLGPMRMLMAELRRTEGDAAGAIREQQKVLEQAPNNVSAIAFLSSAYVDNGEANKAHELLESHRAKFADNFLWRQAWAWTLAAEGRRDEAVAAMDETTLKLASSIFLFTLQTASFYASVGDTERALEWIERAVRNGDERTGWFRRNPAFAALRDTPGFARIVESVEARRAR